MDHYYDACALLLMIITKIYLLIVFLMSFMGSDLSNIILTQAGGIKIYPSDLLTGVLVLLTFSVLFRVKTINVPKIETYYIIFLLWLLIEIIIGYYNFGYRAFGESRIVTHFFYFVVPIALFYTHKKLSSHELINILFSTIKLSALAGMFMFMIELIHGGRFYFSQSSIDTFDKFEDFRGIRLLDSYQTFNILVMAALCLFQIEFKEKNKAINIILASILTISVLITKNRTALYAIAATMLMYYVINNKIKWILYFSIVASVVLAAFYFIQPEVVNKIWLTFASGLNPSEDATGKWRSAVNLIAMQQAFESPWLGKSLGGFFYFVIPGYSQPVEAAPHNQFIYLFLKAGIVGFLLCCASLMNVVYKLNKTMKTYVLDDKQKTALSVLILILLSQLIYGLGYHFIPFYGLYFGFAILLIRSIRRSERKIAVRSGIKKIDSQFPIK